MEHRPRRRLADPAIDIYFDASATGGRPERVLAAFAAGKHVYVEKPIAENLEDALTIARAAERAGKKGGVVQDKLFLPGLKKLRRLYDAEFFGRVLSVRLDFGWWVFDGELIPAQRPSWNYRKATGGGLILDMFAHWRYIFDRLLGPITAVSCRHATLQPRRIDEAGRPYDVDVEDHAFATVRTRRRRLGADQLVLGEPRQARRPVADPGRRHPGSAVAGLHRCFIQPAVATPRPFFSPEVPQAMEFDAQWQEMPDLEPFENGYRAGWELFLRHVAEDGPFPAPLHRRREKRAARRSLLPKPPRAPLGRSAAAGAVTEPPGIGPLTLSPLPARGERDDAHVQNARSAAGAIWRKCCRSPSPCSQGRGSGWGANGQQPFEQAL